jgi:hypothetical protein
MAITGNHCPVRQELHLCDAVAGNSQARPDQLKGREPAGVWQSAYRKSSNEYLRWERDPPRKRPIGYFFPAIHPEPDYNSPQAGVEYGREPRGQARGLTRSFDRLPELAGAFNREQVVGVLEESRNTVSSGLASERIDKAVLRQLFSVITLRVRHTPRFLINPDDLFMRETDAARPRRAAQIKRDVPRLAAAEGEPD